MNVSIREYLTDDAHRQLIQFEFGEWDIYRSLLPDIEPCHLSLLLAWMSGHEVSIRSSVEAQALMEIAHRWQVDVLAAQLSAAAGSAFFCIEVMNSTATDVLRSSFLKTQQCGH